MSMIIDGTNGLTFNDSSTQSSTAVGYSPQTWQNVSASRTSGSTYTNTTGRPIMVSAGTSTSGSTGATITATVNGITVANSSTQQINCGCSVSFIVPSGATYVVTASYPWSFFAELR